MNNNSRPIRLKVASPCKVPWSSMTGTDAVRFCGSCQKNVYNLSEMTIEQTEALLASAGDTPCVRFFQRADGTVMSADCPVGAARVRRQRVAIGVGASLLSAVGVAALGAPMQGEPARPACALEPPAHLAPPPATVEPSQPVEPIEMMGEPMPVHELMGRPAAPPPELHEVLGAVAPVVK